MKRTISNGTTFIASSAFFHIQNPTSSSVIFFKNMVIFMAIKSVKFQKFMAENQENLH